MWGMVDGRRGDRRTWNWRVLQISHQLKFYYKGNKKPLILNNGSPYQLYDLETFLWLIYRKASEGSNHFLIL